MAQIVEEGVAERYTGARVRRSEDPRILTGTGRYVDDVRLPGMVHAAFLRSPFAHARVTRVDVEEARRAPGVVAVYTGEDMAELLKDGSGPQAFMGMGGGGGPKFSLLATDKVRVVGDPVALVVAESRYLAEDACELIEVDYDELPAVTTAKQALEPGSAPIFEDLGTNVLVAPKVTTFGDVEGTFARADRVIHANLHVHRHQNVPMECRGSVSQFDADTGELTMHQCNQGVHMTRRMLSAQLGMDIEKVRVLAGDIGGSFGLKAGAAREDVACAAAARALGRPVKWMEDRNENLTFSGQAREESFEVDAAVTDQGDVLGLKVKMLIDTGAYPGMGGMLERIVMGMIPGPYKMTALEFEFQAAITNKATYVAYRGPWASE
ncbi:MAG: xanthine dehydrogenase family protein molybdopterin-binding subunit, partial [Acidimicrobiales bacterium]|nr:xanthine dehydrogenase family protein molybdopterin-binding subunit [Acidimicrobiales bacterium]